MSNNYENSSSHLHIANNGDDKFTNLFSENTLFNKHVNIFHHENDHLESRLFENIIQIVEYSSEGINYEDLVFDYKHIFDSDPDYASYGFESLIQCIENIPGLYLKNVNGVLKVYYNDSSIQMTSLESQKFEEDVESFSDVSGISDKLKEKFRKLLQHHPRGIFSRKFLKSYEVFHKEEFDLSQTPYYNLVDLVNALPDIFIRVNIEGCQSDYLLFSADAAMSQQILQNFEPKSSEVCSASSLENIISCIRKILQAHPAGVFIDEFENIFRINCEVPFNIFGHDSLASFFKSIKCKVPLEFKYCDENLNRLKVYLPCNDKSLSSPKKMKTTSRLILPGAEYCHEKLPDLQKDEYFPVLVGALLSPSEIYIHLKGDSTSKELDNIESELELLYDTSATDEQYVMKAEHILIGTPCAAIWDDTNNWYRSKIIAIEDSKVKVLFVDYGNMGIVLKKNLRYLKENHFDLPAQAIKTRLAFVEPFPNEPWSTKVRNELHYLCFECYTDSLLAKVVASKFSYDIPSIILCHVTDFETEIYLNLLLVEKGLAVYFDERVDNDCPDIQPANTENAVLTYEENNNETFYSDDDDDIFEEVFNEICQKSNYVQRYVERVNLQDGYVIHLIALEGHLYIPSCDILNIFWPSGNKIPLQQRLYQYDIHVTRRILFESEYSNLFQQLECFNVSGIKDINGKLAISLYLLYDFMLIINEFGHPSHTIRREIRELTRKFDPASTFWQSFIKPTEKMLNNVVYTRNSDQLCLYDLYSILEGFKFKRLKIFRENINSDSVLRNQIQLYDELIVKYQRRIMEIEALCYR